MPPPLPTATVGSHDEPYIPTIRVYGKHHRRSNKPQVLSSLIGYAFSAIVTAGIGYVLWQRMQEQPQQVVVQQVEPQAQPPQPQKSLIERPRPNPNSRTDDATERGAPNPERFTFPQAADLAIDKTADVDPSPPTTKSLRIDLSLQSSHWETLLELPNPIPELTLTSIDSSPGVSIQLEPSSGRLSTESPLKVGFEKLAGLELSLRLKQPDGEACRLVGDWSWSMVKGDISFSLTRMQRQDRFLAKQQAEAQKRVLAAEAEKERLRLFIESHTIKRLDSVGQAKNQIQAIDTALPGIKSDFRAASSALESFRQAVSHVQNIQNHAVLVIQYPAEKNAIGKSESNSQQ